MTRTIYLMKHLCECYCLGQVFFGDIEVTVEKTLHWRLKQYFFQHLCECQCLGQAMDEARLECESEKQATFWDKR